MGPIRPHAKASERENVPHEAFEYCGTVRGEMLGWVGALAEQLLQQAFGDAGWSAGRDGVLTMTKQHFIALADALRLTEPTDTAGATEYQQWKCTVAAIADVCARQNPRFNRERWLDYINGECGPNGGKRKGN